MITCTIANPTPRPKRRQLGLVLPNVLLRLFKRTMAPNIQPQRLWFRHHPMSTTTGISTTSSLGKRRLAGPHSSTVLVRRIHTPPHRPRRLQILLLSFLRTLIQVIRLLYCPFFSLRMATPDHGSFGHVYQLAPISIKLTTILPIHPCFQS